MLLISKCQQKGKRYPTIKKWFLGMYPEIVQFGMPEVEPDADEEAFEYIDTPVDEAVDAEEAAEAAAS